jgi:uncharacterized repeat protein (TIGR01451 family)
VPVVVDPAAPVVVGPDQPRRPAQYSYEVTNTGDVPLALNPNPPVENPVICGPLTFEGGDTNADGLLDVGETWDYSCNTLLQRSQGTPPPTGAESAFVTNHVSVTGTPSVSGTLHPDATVSASDQAQVLVTEPSIHITKSASPPVVEVGGAVTYTFVVSNTGDVGLNVLGPNDDQCSPLVPAAGNDANHNGFLDGADSGAPESWTYTCTREVGLPTPPATTNDNTVTVGGVDGLGNLYTSTATASVRVLDPAIDLVKTVSSELVPSGRQVTYGFDATNIGTSPLPADDVLANVTLADSSTPATPACASPTFVGGDTNGNNQLDRVPAEVWHYECTATITQPTHDIAIVKGTAGLGFNPQVPIDVFAADFAFTRPFTPAIDVTKTASPTLLLGSGVVTYTYTVRNTGNVPLGDVKTRITDNTCSPLTYVSGDTDGDGLLDTPNSIFEDAANEIWTFTCKVTLDKTTTNTVTVTGTPTDMVGAPLCGAQTPNPDPCDATDTANATVTVVAPGTITIVKKTTAPSTATFPFALGTTQFTLASGASRTFTPLAPGPYKAVEGPTSGYALTGLACTDPSGGTVVDTAHATANINLAAGETVVCTFTNTRVPKADVVITKSVSSGMVTPGDEVTFMLLVKNLGPDTAEDVVVTDLIPAGVTVLQVPAGCVLKGSVLTCAVGDLAPGASTKIVVPVRVTAVGTFTNLASVDAKTVDPNPDNNHSFANVVGAATLPPTGSEVMRIVRLGWQLLFVGAVLAAVGFKRRRRRLA